MKARNRVATLLVGLGFLIGVAAGYAAGQLALGITPSHWLHEDFRMSQGVTGAGNPDRPRRIQFDRQVLNVPQHYGKLFAITASGEGRAILWYESADGLVRNVVVGNADDSLLAVRSVPVRDLRLDAKR